MCAPGERRCGAPSLATRSPHSAARDVRLGPQRAAQRAGHCAAMPDLHHLSTFQPGDSLGPYTLVCPVAEGGMGSIWAASFAGAGGLSRSVAIKLLLPELAEDEQYARALRDEAQLA